MKEVQFPWLSTIPTWVEKQIVLLEENEIKIWILDKVTENSFPLRNVTEIGKIF
jgi:hypothetical protein